MTSHSFWTKCRRLFRFVIRHHKHHLIAAGLILVWVIPYFTTGERLQWGDITYYAQMQEAIRLNIMEFHQFPWWNPWMAGGTPLYANPQAGVFSLQTLFALLFGGSLGLKIALSIYTAAGYASMFILLRRYFKVEVVMATALSLAWLFCGFFVAHLPNHLVFQWLMLGPLFVYLALTIRTLKGGLLLGVLLGLNALSAFHYAFIQTLTLVVIIMGVRLALRRQIAIFKAGLVAAGTMLALAGHRMLFTMENVSDFPRVLADPATTIANSVLSFLLPYSRAHELWFIKYPKVPFGWGEQTAFFGLLLAGAVVLSGLFYLFSLHRKTHADDRYHRTGAVVLICGLGFLVLGLGAFAAWAPWSIVNDVPPFTYTRVSPRWFLWVVCALLIFLGITATKTARQSLFRFVLYGVIFLGVAELFVLNAGYQYKVLDKPVVKPAHPTSYYTFQQQLQFGETLQLYGGKGTLANDGGMPHFYREFEATRFNIGTIQANDSLVDLNTKPTPRCSWVSKHCKLVLSDNAKVAYWSPEKIVLERTKKGPIKLNFNNSNYFLINGTRNKDIRVAEPYQDFVIHQPDSVKTITIQVKPELSLGHVRKILGDVAAGQK